MLQCIFGEEVGFTVAEEIGPAAEVVLTSFWELKKV